jgi:hypothetical protein
MRFPLIIITVCLIPAAAAQQPASASATGVEEIYIARSIVQSRLTPTPYCAQEHVGFVGATVEQEFTFHSVTTRSSDGLLTNPKQNTIGNAHGCVGPSGDPVVLNFYLEGAVGATHFKAIGGCRWGMENPESGIRFLNCLLPLQDLPEGYVGGYLTSNSITSRQPVGEASEPFGYLQSSIATIRLWRRR